MKYLLLSLMVILSACTQSDDLALYKTNLEIVKKALSCYETPQDFETFKSLIHEDVQHQSPMYGQGLVDYDGVLAQAKFYMEGFKNITFENPIWLPGVNDTTLVNNGSVRVYGVWTATHTESQKDVNLRSYHYWDFDENGLILTAGDYFDATGMMMSLQD